LIGSLSGVRLSSARYCIASGLQAHRPINDRRQYWLGVEPLSTYLLPKVLKRYERWLKEIKPD
jgi:hypothetical protein